MSSNPEIEIKPTDRLEALYASEMAVFEEAIKIRKSEIMNLMFNYGKCVGEYYRIKSQLQLDPLSESMKASLELARKGCCNHYESYYDTLKEMLEFCRTCHMPDILRLEEFKREIEETMTRIDEINTSLQKENEQYENIKTKMNKTIHLNANLYETICECGYETDTDRYTDEYKELLEDLCKKIVNEFNSLYEKKIEVRDIIEFVGKDIEDISSGYFNNGKDIETRSHYVKTIGDIYFTYSKLKKAIDTELSEVVLCAGKN